MWGVAEANTRGEWRESKHWWGRPTKVTRASVAEEAGLSKDQQVTATRVAAVLGRQGALIEEQGMSYLGEIDADHALTPLQAAS